MNSANQAGLPHLGNVQRLRKRVLLGCAVALVAALPFTASIYPPESSPHETIEAFGFVLIVLCVLGRTWSTLYIGGRKKHAIVADGPYSLVRNPLYVFSVVGAGGIGLTTGSGVVGLGLALVTFLVFDAVIRREERYLRGHFGAAYDSYAARVSRWRPKVAGWHDIRQTVVQPRLVLITFRDASLFLIAIPLSEGLDHLQQAGYLPVLLQLP